MSNYDMTDRYGAVMILKAMIDSTAEQMNDEKLGIMRKAFELVHDKLAQDAADINADICKEFTGTIMGLAEKLKENEDDKTS